MPLQTALQVLAALFVAGAVYQGLRFALKPVRKFIQNAKTAVQVLARRFGDVLVWVSQLASDASSSLLSFGSRFSSLSERVCRMFESSALISASLSIICPRASIVLGQVTELLPHQMQRRFALTARLTLQFMNTFHFHHLTKFSLSRQVLEQLLLTFRKRQIDFYTVRQQHPPPFIHHGLGDSQQRLRFDVRRMIVAAFHQRRQRRSEQIIAFEISLGFQTAHADTMIIENQCHTINSLYAIVCDAFIFRRVTLVMNEIVMNEIVMNEIVITANIIAPKHV